MIPMAMSDNDAEIKQGSALPLGAIERCDGTNFAVFSRHATQLSLLLFDEPTDGAPSRTIQLDPVRHRTGDIWHVWIKGVGARAIYAWCADGDYQPEHGHRFNPHKVLLDPYARILVGTDCWDFSCLCNRGSDAVDDSPWKAKALVSNDIFDWQGDQPLKLPWTDTVIYETHVRGLTMHPSSAVQHSGCFLGVVEKIPYFQSLGITALELMPVQEFHENELIRHNPVTGEPLRNYWGYSTVGFFAPKESYASRDHWGCQLSEFKTMVREIHRAGIEVILDIVFNHTAEGNHLGPTLNFRGLDNAIYYLLEKDQRYYKNYSGTGNTLNCNHPVVRDYILDCLRYWVMEMHVDGFRFDLASVLGRDRHGNLLANPPLLERIAEDPILRNVKLIAEAWDAAGAYQVGSFPGLRWSEWNGRYRDDVRRFWRGDAGMSGALASRLCGSADIYQYGGKSPIHSVNFITCHDGFTLNDLVSYAEKHNRANGENNADGSNDNYSANYGVEGFSDDPVIENFRLQQIKNMLATLLLSRGVPMLLGGDEFGRTQQGNNNAYCQDNELSWVNWDLLKSHQELLRFVGAVIKLRQRFTVLRAEQFYTAQEIQWFGPDLTLPDWQGPQGVLACKIVNQQKQGEALCLLFNATLVGVNFRLLSPPAGCVWQVLLDTTQSVPEAGYDPAQAYPLTQADRCLVPAHSLMVLYSGKVT